MKRKLLTVFSILLSLIAMLAIFAACGGDEQSDNVDKPTDHTVTEEYYYDANGTEYLISLRSENYFTYSIAGDQAEGTYKLEGGTLTLTPTEGTALSGTVSGNVLNLTYKENPYTFRLKVNYTVRFDAKGGSSVSDSSVLNGKTVAKPQDPAKTGETFVGWYMDEGFHNAYSFSQRVTGDLTLYARYVAPIDPEFTVSFEGDGTEGIAARTTTGGMLFDLPTPQKEGAEFVGWYVSQSGSPTKLSYRYNEQAIEENITLYAVWDDGSPVVSVSESGVTVENLGVNERYTISIVDSNNVTVKSTTSTDAAFSYDFSSAAAGEYTVTVVLGGKSTVRYFSNKTLAHVTVFKVTGYTLSFNGVKNATGYLLNATCASGHTHTNIEIDPETRSWSFESEGCELPIVFTVTAVADGFASSVSTPFNFTRTLAPVKSLAVSDDTSKVTWDAVENATSYHVSVVKGSDEVLSQNVGNVTEFDLSALDPDTYTVSVTPVARGWLSPDASSSEYKKARLATPQNLNYRNDTVTWDAVKGAASYTVVIDGVEFKDIAETSLSLAGKLKDGQNEHTISVRALPAEGYLASFDSAVFKLVSALSKPAYKGGILSWNAVEGVNSYVVTVDGVSETVTGNSYKVTFTRAGSIFLSVSALYDDGTQSAPQEIAVSVYALTFDMNKEGEKPLQTLYLAEGDPYNFPTDPSFTGNNFVGWRSAPTGGEAIDKDGDKTFDLKQDCTYYAAWAAKRYTITFNAGRYGEMPAGKETFEIEYGARDLALYLPTVTDPNRAFVAWHLVNDVGVLVTEADGSGNLKGAFTQADNVTLYAEYVTVFEFHEYKTGSYSVTMGEGLKQNIVKSIRIPYQYGTGTVTRMEGFLNCTSVTSVEMPDTIEIFDGGNNGERFGGFTALESITVYSAGASAPLFSSDQGVLYFNRNGQIEVACCPMAKSGEVTIREDAKDIAEGAFYKAAKISKVTVAGQITTIHTKAFVDCTALNAIEFNAYTAGNTLTIENDAFSGCSNVETLRLPAYLNNVTAETFKKLTGLNAFEVEGTGDYSAVDGYLCGPYNGNADLKEIIAAPVDKYIEYEGKVGTFGVPSGVVSIAEGVFAENSLITDIIIPNWVQNIGKNAFFHLTNLNSITFDEEDGASNLKIGEGAFYAGHKNTSSGSDAGHNDKVKELILPPNLVEIGANAFGRYRNLKEVTINANRDSVNYAANAFVGADGESAYVQVVNISKDCPEIQFSSVFGGALRAVNVPDGNRNYSSKDGVVYNSAKTAISFFPKEYVGPNGDGAYEIPATVTAIDANVFANAANLTSVVIPASVTSVGEHAFDGCRKLRSVTFTAATEEGAKLTIGNSAFESCYALSDITLPAHLTELGTAVFKNCTALQSLELPSGLALIQTATQADQTVRFDIFDGCTALTSVTVAKGNTHFSTGDGNVLYRAKEVKLSENGVNQFVPYEALYVLPGASGTITVPSTVRVVYSRVFTDIPNVTSIVCEDSVDMWDADTGTLIEEYDFHSYAFYGTGNTSVKEIVLPAGLTEMTDFLIYNWAGLQKLTIPNTVTTIAPKVTFLSWNITSIIFEEGGEEPLTIQGAHEQNGAVAGRDATHYSLFGRTITGGETTNNMLKLDSVVLPSRLANLGEYAFYLSPVNSVTFEGGKVDSLIIGPSAFAECNNLTGFVIPEGTTSIGGNAFDGMTFDEIKLPSTLTAVSDYAFLKVKLSAPQDVLVIPASVTSIGTSAFQDNSYLHPIKSVDLSAAVNLTSIGSNAFAQMSALESVTFVASAPEAAMAETAPVALTIKNNAFFANPKLTSVVLPANLVEIQANAFEKCASLANVTFETYKDGEKAGKSDLTTIKTCAFGNTGLTHIAFPESTAEKLTLEKNLFQFCSKLTEVYLSSSVRSISNIFAGCGSIQTISVAENSPFKTGELPALYDEDGKSVLFVYRAVEGEINILGTQVAGGAFYGQSEITKIIIAPTVVEIGEKAFANCVSLKEVEFESGSSLTTLGTGVFMNCVNLESINLERCTQLQKLPDCNNNPDTRLFSNCTSLKSIKLPSSLTTIGKYSLGNAGFESIDFSACKSLASLGVFAFSDNAALTSVDLSTCKEIKTWGNHMFANDVALQWVDLSNCTGITALGNNDFASCSSLQDVYLPDSITFLSTGTFSGCTSLKEIDLSNTSIVHISNTSGKVQGSDAQLYVFQNCTSLETVRFPATLKSIGHYTFNGATSLKEVYIGDGAANDLTALETLYKGVFYNSGIPNVKLSGSTKFTSAAPKWNSGNTSITDYNGIFEACTNLKRVIFTDDIKTIPTYMFYGCSNLTDVNFTDLTALTTIATFAFDGCGFTDLDLSKCESGKATLLSAANIFSNCVNLKSFKLNAGITKVGNYTFQNTGFETLDLSAYPQVTSWGQRAFQGCLKLTEVYIPANLGGNPGDYMFDGCTELKKVTFGEGYNMNLSKQMFSNCTLLTDVDLSKAITSGNGSNKIFGAGIFQNCTSLRKIDMSNLTFERFNSDTFDGCESLEEVKLPDTLNVLGENTFRNCISLRTIDLSNTAITRLPSSASNVTITSSNGGTFSGCTNLRRVILPKGVTQIGHSVFYGCTNLEEIVNLDFSALTHIGNWAFAGCSSLAADIILGNNLTLLGESAFNGCESASLSIAATNVQLVAGTGYTLAYVNGRIIGTNAAGATLFESVVYNTGDAGSDTLKLTGAFNATNMAKFFQNFNIEGVTKVDLSEVTGFTSIPSYMFQNSTFEEVILPDTIATIGTYAFDGSEIVRITIPASVTNIETAAFTNTKKLDTVIFEEPEDPTSAKALTVQNGTSEKFGKIPAAAAGVFLYSAVKHVVLSTRTITNGTHMFYRCASLESVEIPEGFTSIPDNMFMESGLLSVSIPASVTKIGKNAFQNSKLKSLVIKGNPTFGTYAFSHCEDLKSVDFGPCTKLNSQAFEYSGLEELTIPETLTVGYQSFQYSEQLKKVVFEGTRERLGDTFVFMGCTGLTDVTLPEGMTFLDNNSFKGCTSLTTISLPETLTSIGTGAFQDSGLTGDIVLPETVTSLGNYAFAGCTGIHSITLSASVGTISNIVFEGWTADQEFRFRNSRFEVMSACGAAWLKGAQANVVYNYGAEE